LVDRIAKRSYNVNTVDNKERNLKQTELEDSWSVVGDDDAKEPSRSWAYWTLGVISAVSMAVIVLAAYKII